MALKRKNTLPLLLLEDAPSKNKPWELVQVSTATWIGRCVLGLKHDWLIKRHWWRHIGAASQVLSKTALSVHLFPPLLSVSLVSFYEFMKHLSLSRSLEMKMRYQVPSLQLQEGCGIGNCWKGCLCLHYFVAYHNKIGLDRNGPVVTKCFCFDDKQLLFPWSEISFDDRTQDFLGMLRILSGQLWISNELISNNQVTLCQLSNNDCLLCTFITLSVFKTRLSAFSLHDSFAKESNEKVRSVSAHKNPIKRQ